MDEKELRKKLNEVYDEIEKLDKQIDLLKIKRQHLMNKIETGVAVILMMDKK